MKSLIALILFVSILLAVLTEQVLAYEIPQFSSCLNPTGEIKANYEDGTHGIVGSSADYTGKDTVYSLSGDALTQCFCSSNGSGIQTNWWKVSSLTEDEVEILKSQGWNYIPNGALWGLEGAPYLAFNSQYICQSPSAGSGGFSPTTDIPGPGGGGGQGGSVLGINTGSVLGLASTGNSKFLFSVLFTSIFSLLLGIILKKRSKKCSK